MGKIKVEKPGHHKGKEQEWLEPLKDEPVAEAEAPENSGAAQVEEARVQVDTDEMRKKLEDADRQYLYLRADFANYKRNAEQERGSLAELGKEAVLTEVFTIYELLERAINSGREHGVENSVLSGLELVHKEFQKIFDKYKVERIKTVGEPFNPAFHDAISIVEDAEHEPDTIVFEHQPGFMRDGKVLRPARVVVAKSKG